MLSRLRSSRIEARSGVLEHVPVLSADEGSEEAIDHRVRFKTRR